MLIARDKDGNIHNSEVILVYKVWMIEQGERWNSNNVYGLYFSKDKAIEAVKEYLEKRNQTNHYYRTNELLWEHSDDYIEITEMEIN